jgi:peptidyl-Asp metalloendopeptidase
MRIPARPIFAVALALGCITTAASAGPLFAPLEQENARVRAALFDPGYRALAEDPAMSDLRVVKVDAAQVTLGAQVIRLPLSPGLLVTAQRVDAYRTKEGLLVWQGILLDGGVKGPLLDPRKTVTLVRHGGKLTGTVSYAGQWYHLRPLRLGGHALVAVQVDRMPADELEDAPLPLVPAPAPPGAAAQAAASTSRTVVRLMVNYTDLVAATTDDVLGLITLAVAETNQSYANSGLQLELELAGTSQVAYVDTASSNTDLRRYQGTRDGYMDEIHALRTAVQADAGVLLVRNMDACGRASGIGSTYDSAFAIVRVNCATGANRYTFGHEIGHLQWARHDPDNDARNRPYPFGHGFRRETEPAFRTMMAYDCIPACAPRVLYWSSPSLLYSGLPMGTDATHNNARVLNTTKTTVAGFFAPACIPDGGVAEVSGAAACCSGYAVPGTAVCNHQGDCTEICGTPLVDGCVPPGGIDDVLSATTCCSGTAVAGSTWCLDQDDWGVDWTSCVRTCA